MTYEQYLNADTDEIEAYRLSFEQRREQINAEQWRNGLYVYNAIGCFVGTIASLGKAKPMPYVAKPFPITEEEARKREEAENKAYYENMLQAYRAMSKGAKNDTTLQRR